MKTGREIIIGDLHGCFNEAVELLEKCKVTKDDRVILCGDLVDRGPDSGKCLDLAIEIEERQKSPSAILGNHEDKHLSYYKQILRGKKPSMSPHHAQAAAQFTTKHYDYMAKMPLYIRLPEHNAVVVHAGVFPGKTIEEQERHHLLHIQMIKPSEGTQTKWPSKAPDPSWKFWTNYWDGPEKIIFGHSVLDKVLHTDKVCGIDGGSCFGGWMHALILPSWEIISVKCSGHYGTRMDTIAEFHIHGDVKAYS